MLQKLSLHLHFTKSLKRDNVYQLCLWLLEEHICLAFSKTKIWASAWKYKLLLHWAESLKRDNIDKIC